MSRLLLSLGLLLVPTLLRAQSSPGDGAFSAGATFTRITEGALVETPDWYTSQSWGDYDDDGDLDVFVGAQIASTRNHLYRNDRQAGFARVDDAGMPRSPSNQHTSSWGDYDNDGDLDLIVTAGNPEVSTNMLYRNGGDGTFSWTDTAMSREPFIDGFHAARWGDYDNDGLIDLFIAGHDPHNRLFYNNGDGSFTKLANHALVNDLGTTEDGAFVDYDDDGDIDVYVPNMLVGGSYTGVLYQNQGGGAFTRVTDSGLSDLAITDLFATAACWADYDNDGLQDLFQVNTRLNSLYHNDGDGRFTRIADSVVVQDSIPPDQFWSQCAWGDYDNDGFVDLVVIAPNLGVQTAGLTFLYRNNGDGSFTKVTDSAVVTTAGTVGGPSWVDYDNDGFLDLFGVKGIFAPDPQTNRLYHNDGNANAWINLKLVGTISNRSAIGAKARVKAFFRGASRWQLREISGGGGAGNQQQSLNAEFGLADATIIDTVRVEWPSGTVQELHGVSPRQFLTITEPDDPEGDGIPHPADNCPLIANADQLDTDGDGRGDVCDPCPTGIGTDADRDGTCDAEDSDDDNDGSLDRADNCPLIANADQADREFAGAGDGVGDACDNCPYWATAAQLDTDRDGRGNVCECTDQNGDGRNTVSDLVSINQALFNPEQITSLCDGNNNRVCESADIVAAVVEIFSPGNTSTCERQPVPGP